MLTGPFSDSAGPLFWHQALCDPGCLDACSASFLANLFLTWTLQPEVQFPNFSALSPVCFCTCFFSLPGTFVLHPFLHVQLIPEQPSVVSSTITFSGEPRHCCQCGFVTLQRVHQHLPFTPSHHLPHSVRVPSELAWLQPKHSQTKMCRHCLIMQQPSNQCFKNICLILFDPAGKRPEI